MFKNFKKDGLLIIFAITAAFFFSNPEISIAAPFKDFDIPFEAEEVGLQKFPIEGNTESFEGARTDGSVQISAAVMAIVEWTRNILGTLAVIYITYHAYLIFSKEENESELGNAKAAIRNGIIALTLTFIMEPLVRNVFYGGGDVLAPGEAIFRRELSTGRGIEEIRGIIEWGKMFLGVIAVVMIIVTGAQSMFSDEDSAMDKQKANIQWITAGLILILLNEVLIQSGIYGVAREDPVTNKVVTVRSSFEVITEVSGIVSFFLSFLAVIGVGSLVYGGYLMLFAPFNEENQDKGKEIIKNTAIGAAIILISFTIVQTVLLLEN